MPILSGNNAGVITNGVSGQLVSRGNVGHTSTESAPFTFGLGYGDVSSPAILGTTTTSGTPIGDAHAALTAIGTWDGTTNTGLACTFTFTNGAIDLAADTTHGHVGQYVPGVYCIDGAASIGAAGINLNASGTYVFKINGAFTTVSGSTVTFNGAAGGSNSNAGNVFFASVGSAPAASLGATTQLSGTVLTGSGAITTGANDNMTNARFISESAITIGGGANLFSSPPAILTPVITISPTSGPMGTLVTVSGSGFADSSAVTIKYDGTQVTTTTTTASGAIPSGVTFVVPASAAGIHTVQATDASSNTASTTFTVTAPAITISPTSSPAGTQVTVSGSGFAPSSTVTITYDGSTVTTSPITVTTTASGAIPSGVTFVVPASAAGIHTVQATDASSNTASTTFLVTIISVPEFPIGGMVFLVIASMSAYLVIRYKALKTY